MRALVGCLVTLARESANLAGDYLSGVPGAAAPVRTLAEEQGLVQTERVDGADPVGIGGQEGFAVGEDRVVDGVPVTAQLLGDLVG